MIPRCERSFGTPHLWGEDPPATAAHALEVYVSRLRKVLGSEALARSGGGYRLALPAEQIDTFRFERLLAEGEDTLAHDRVRAAMCLTEALSLWRGAPLADFTYEPFAQAEIARLDELRHRAEEARVEVELALGRGAALVGTLEGMIARTPLRERPRALLMRALYQAGRQADALAAYQTARQMLIGELGIEPGPELNAVQRAILAHDPALAAPSVATARPRQARRWLTVLVCDLVASPAGASAVDPEVLDALLDRYSETASAAVARHGGTVQELAGESLVAVFGLPLAHEDDPLRALRAAGEIRANVSALEQEFEQDSRVHLAARFAIDSGELVTGTTTGGRERVTGEAATGAARLQAAAEPGEVVVGEATRRLVAHAARLEPRAPVEIVPGGRRVPTWHLLGLLPEAPALPRSFGADLVGRTAELAELRQHFARTVRDRRPVLITVIGEPGIGKTRLAREFATSLEEAARVLVPRLLPYGEEAVLAPLRDLIEQAAGARSREALLTVLAADAESEAVADRLGSVLGARGAVLPREEIFWAVRRLLEALGRERPLLLILDDLHWAAPTFLDLLEYLAQAASGSIMLLCLARKDLVEVRPRWPERSPMVALSPLSPSEGHALVSDLSDQTSVPEGDRARITAVGGGNPLFLEQLIVFAAETSGANAIPPTLESLLASRLDRLGPAERQFLEVAATVGTEFSLAAVTALLPAEFTSTAVRHSEALTRKEFLESVPPPAPFITAARFHHVLLRNAAYRSIPKSRRAELHERLADWLTEAAEPLRGDDELVGHHLEQACRYRQELGHLDEGTRKLTEEAARRFAAAGSRAHDQHDHATAADLLLRSASLLASDDPLRLALLPDLGDDLFWLGRYGEARSLLADAVQSARRSRDRAAEWHARLAQARVQAQLATGGLPSLRVVVDKRDVLHASLLS